MTAKVMVEVEVTISPANLEELREIDDCYSGEDGFARAISETVADALSIDAEVRFVRVVECGS